MKNLLNINEWVQGTPCTKAKSCQKHYFYMCGVAQPAETPGQSRQGTISDSNSSFIALNLHRVVDSMAQQHNSNIQVQNPGTQIGQHHKRSHKRKRAKDDMPLHRDRF